MLSLPLELLPTSPTALISCSKRSYFFKLRNDKRMVTLIFFSQSNIHPNTILTKQYEDNKCPDGVRANKNKKQVPYPYGSNRCKSGRRNAFGDLQPPILFLQTERERFLFRRSAERESVS